MIELNKIREEKENYVLSLSKRGIDVKTQINEVLHLDNKRKKLNSR